MKHKWVEKWTKWDKRRQKFVALEQLDSAISVQRHLFYKNWRRKLQLKTYTKILQALNASNIQMLQHGVTDDLTHVLANYYFSIKYKCFYILTGTLKYLLHYKSISP